MLASEICRMEHIVKKEQKSACEMQKNIKIKVKKTFKTGQHKHINVSYGSEIKTADMTHAFFLTFGATVSSSPSPSYAQNGIHLLFPQ